MVYYLNNILFVIMDSQETPEDGGWHDLVSNGFIEYIDTEEEETTMISMTINVSNNTWYEVCSVFMFKKYLRK